MPTLTIQLPGHPPVEHVLREETITLGRSLANRIALDHSSVSQSHATISRIGNDYFLQDLQSTNGTLLNGQSVREARLHDRDILKLGEAVAIFELRSTGATAPTLAVLAASSAANPATRSAKSDTAMLSVKAKTTLLKPVSPGASSGPAAPVPGGKSPIALAASLLGVAAVAGVAGLLAWMLLGGTTTQPTVVTVATPQTQPKAQTNTIVETAAPPPPTEPVMAAEVGVEADPTAEPETNNLPELLAALKSPDVVQRRYAAEALNDLGPAATNALLNLRLALLQDADPEVRLWLAFALVNNQTYDHAAIPVLVHGLSDERAELRQQACATLALIPYDESGKSNVVPALKTAAEDQNENVRKAALAALKTIAPEEVPSK
jgi:hypothetical protein